jgi:catechol 2,3-dioxygenase-like lactoylglutathione lyase family enzyme
MSKERVLWNHYPIYHLSYFVPDLKKAIQQHHEIFGSGPYLVVENIKVDPVYRGKPGEFQISMATGWWGDVAIELVQQHNDGPSYYRDNDGRFGFHHVCIGVSDVKKAIKEFEDAGCPLSCFADRPNYPWAYIDCTASWGMFVEINPGPDPVYKAVKKWAEGWDKETKLLRSYADMPK